MDADDVVAEAVRELGQRLPTVPRLATVLGSGLGGLAEALEEPVSVSFDELPGLPSATVAGHGGRFVGGRLDGVAVLLQCGRVHGYEGATAEQIVTPVRILASLGVETLLITNAAGGVRPGLAPGDLVLINDQIDLTFRPLSTAAPTPGAGRSERLGDPFDRVVSGAIRDAARDCGVPLAGGTYGGLHGPSYETRAEIRMLARMGVDVVGMSTVSEVAAARAAGLRVAAISLVTNLATGLSPEALAHEEVLAVGSAGAGRLTRILGAAIPRLEPSSQSTGAK
jgi:purine-nucleoside phosphorylase